MFIYEKFTVNGIVIIAPEVTPSIAILVVLVRIVLLNNAVPSVAIIVSTFPLTDLDVAIVENSSKKF